MAKGGARPKSFSGRLGIFGSLKKKLGFGPKNEQHMQQQQLQQQEVQVMQQQQQFPVMQQQQAYGYASDSEKEAGKHRQGIISSLHFLFDF